MPAESSITAADRREWAYSRTEPVSDWWVWDILGAAAIGAVLYLLTHYLSDPTTLTAEILAIGVTALVALAIPAARFAYHFARARGDILAERLERASRQLEHYQRHASNTERTLMAVYDEGRQLMDEEIESDEQLEWWLERVAVFTGRVEALGRRLLTNPEKQRIMRVDVEQAPGSLPEPYDDTHERRWLYLSGLLENIDEGVDRVRGQSA